MVKVRLGCLGVPLSLLPMLFLGAWYRLDTSFWDDWGEVRFILILASSEENLVPVF